jgi:DNA transformation protein and related proteins
MAVSSSYKTYVLEQLQVVGSVTAKPMFGGIGLYAGGVFFGLMDDDSLYFKVDETTRVDFEQAGSRAFQPYGENSYSMKYYEVPADVLESRPMLTEWATKAVAVARKTTARRKPRSP